MTEPRIIKKTFVLVGVEGDMKDVWPDFEPRLCELRRTVIEKLPAIEGCAKPARMVGFWHMCALPSGVREYRYFAGVEADAAHPPAGLIAHVLPESLYAVFTEQKRGTIGSPNGYAYKQWLPSSEYVGNKEIHGDFEIFRNMANTGPECEAEILIPVRAKQDEELVDLIVKFAGSGWDVLVAPSRAWLVAGNRKEAAGALVAAIEQADATCGRCGCEFDPLYKRALTLLNV